MPDGVDELESPREEKTYRDLLNLLYEITSMIPSKLDVYELIKSMVIGLKQLGFDRAGVWLLNEAEDTLRGIWGTDESGNLKAERDEELPLEVLPPLHGYLLRITDAKFAKELGIEAGADTYIPKGEESRFEEIWTSKPPYPGYYERTERGDNIFLPIVVLGKAIGAIGADNFITGRRIDEEDAEILAMFTANMGIVLHNAKLMAELHQRTAFLESILDSANLWINLMDSEGNITLWNKAAERISGYSREEVTGHGKIWECLFPCPDYRPQIVSKVRDLTRGMPMEGFETRIVTKSGEERIISWYSTNLHNLDGSPAGGVAIAEDITQRKKLERQLAQSEKMSALGQLISGVAHELNNPLTGVVGYSQLLLGMDCDAETRRMLTIVNRETERCHKIVNSLLQFAREYEPSREYIQIHDVIESTLSLKRYQLYVDNIQLELHLSEDVPKTMADPHQMQQVFMNIVNNAHQAMVEYAGQGRLTVETELQDDTITIRFTDTGPGISEENMERIFEPFFTTKESGRGTGLGLSICHGIVEEHGGRIYADSEVGMGATFTVELPVTAEEAVSTDEPNGEKAVGAALSIHTTPEAVCRTLIVDDEQGVLDLFTDILEMMGHTVVTAKNGNQAMDRLGEGEYDLIICDVKMPGFGGERLYDLVKATDPELANRIVFVTGDTVSPETRNFLQSTGNPYIGKPFRVEEARRIILKSLFRNA